MPDPCAVSAAQRRQGAIWVIFSAAGFGAMAILAKLAYRDGVTLSSMLFLRFAMAGVLMALWGDCAACTGRVAVIYSG